MLERSPAESLRMTRRPTGRPPGRPVKAAVVKAATAVAAPPLVGAGMLLSFDVRPRSALRRVAFGPRPMIDVRAHVPRPLHDGVRELCLARGETLAYFIAEALRARVQALHREE